MDAPFWKLPRTPPEPTTARQLEAQASDGYSPTDVNPPVYTQDEYTLVMPPPAGYNSGRPHLLSSTLLPTYIWTGEALSKKESWVKVGNVRQIVECKSDFSQTAVRRW